MFRELLSVLLCWISVSSANRLLVTFLTNSCTFLGYSKPVVRSSAYNLLCAVATAFELKVQGQLCESPGLCIPANNTLFIVSLSCGLSKRQSHVTLELLEECITGLCIVTICNISFSHPSFCLWLCVGPESCTIGWLIKIFFFICYSPYSHLRKIHENMTL